MAQKINIKNWIDFSICTTAGKLRDKTLEEIIYEQFKVDDLIHMHKEK